MSQEIAKFTYLKYQIGLHRAFIELNYASNQIFECVRWALPIQCPTTPSY